MYNEETRKLGDELDLKLIFKEIYEALLHIIFDHININIHLHLLHYTNSYFT